MQSITFTPSQQSAISAFRTFISDSSQVFMLKGAAGTGKTTILSEFIKILEGVGRQCVLMAPTGRAANILSRKTGNFATTIHRGIYALTSLRSANQNDEIEDDSTVYARFGLKNNEYSFSTIYIIDESSMISDSFSENEAFSFGSGRLLSDLFSFADGRKIVFVGDYAQLPPVNMNFSPALDKDYIENSYGRKVVEVYLRDVMRQKSGAGILDNANIIRDKIDAKTFIEFSLKNGDDVVAENDDLLLPYFSISESKPDIRSIIIAYSNRQALQYNIIVRRHYFGEDAQRLKTGDLLIVSRNNYSYSAELFNGTIVKVESCRSDNEVQRRTVRVKLGKNRIESVELKFRNATIQFAVNGISESLDVLLLDNFLDDPNGSVGGLLSQALIVDFNNRLPEKIKNRIGEIRRLLHAKGQLTSEQKDMCDSYIKLLQTDKFYNAVICKYGYAVTCHKAQGGEWDNVFVDMCRYGGTSNENYFRWVYTAITRASVKLWHYRSPDFNYISNIVVDEIKLSSKIKVSIYSDDTDFCSARFSRIKDICMKYGISVTEDRSKAFQHIISFTDANGNSAIYLLWYNAKGYSTKDCLIKKSSDEFAATCYMIVNDSYAPQSIPFSAPNRPFAEKLVSFMLTQFEETGIRLLNITQEQYQDVFHIKTDGIAQIGLTYTAKGNYTYMRLVSSLGIDDTKLTSLRNRFI